MKIWFIISAHLPHYLTKYRNMGVHFYTQMQYYCSHRLRPVIACFLQYLYLLHLLLYDSL